MEDADLDRLGGPRRPDRAEGGAAEKRNGAQCCHFGSPVVVGRALRSERWKTQTDGARKKPCAGPPSGGGDPRGRGSAPRRIAMVTILCEFAARPARSSFVAGGGPRAAGVKQRSRRSRCAP